jgi:cell wall assembly regulator SMI1
MNEITEVWTQLKSWLATNIPQMLEGMNEGASEQQISDLEANLGVTLPDDYKTFLRLCNGESDDSEVGFYDGELLSARHVWNQAKSWRDLVADGTFEGEFSDPETGIRNDWWNPKWIPFTHSGSGDHLCLDLDPAPGGTVGQVISMWHDDGRREMMYANFTAWLEHVLHGLESGEIVFDQEECQIMDLEDMD